MRINEYVETGKFNMWMKSTPRAVGWRLRLRYEPNCSFSF